MHIGCGRFFERDATLQCVSGRLRAYAKQYVEQRNSMNGFSGDEPLPPNVIFEGVVKF